MWHVDTESASSTSSSWVYSCTLERGREGGREGGGEGGRGGREGGGEEGVTKSYRGREGRRGGREMRE